MGHQRFLQSYHKFRYDKQHFDGKEQLRNPNSSLILQQQESVDVIFDDICMSIYLLPIAIRKILSPNIMSVIKELCYFFRELCSKVIDLSKLLTLQRTIVLTLCHLEMLFPPSFFKVMMHLAVHLIEEVKLGGLIQFRWMYPVERFLVYMIETHFY